MTANDGQKCGGDIPVVGERTNDVVEWRLEVGDALFIL